MMLCAGAAAAVAVFIFNYLKSKHKNPVIFVVFAVCLLSALVLSFFTDYFARPVLHSYPLRELFLSIGFQYYYTAVYFSVLSALAFFIAGIDFKLMNLAAPSLALFSCIARIGCIITGCCGGTAFAGFSSFPTAAAECAFGAAAFVLLQFFIKNRGLGIYLTAYSAFRFIMEFLRIKNGITLFFGVFTTAQIIAVCVSAAGLSGFVLKLIKDRIAKQKCGNDKIIINTAKGVKNEN